MNDLSYKNNFLLMPETGTSPTGIFFNHTNLNEIIITGTLSSNNLSDNGIISIPRNSLCTGQKIYIEAWGTINDPSGKCPLTSFSLNFNSGCAISGFNYLKDKSIWKFTSTSTLRTLGTSGILQTNGELNSFDANFCVAQNQNFINTTNNISLQLIGKIANSDTQILCEQFIVDIK